MRLYEVCPEKGQPLLIEREQFRQNQCNRAAKESGLECAWMNNDNFTVWVSGGRFCVKLEHSCVETIRMIQKAAATGNWWLAASPRQYACSCITSCAEFFWSNIKSPRWLSLTTAHIWHSATSGFFPKLKSPLKGNRFQSVDEIQENTIGQLMAIGRTVWGPKVPTLNATEASLSCVQCFLYLVSSSKNVSSFHSTWLDTFWTDSYFSSLRRIKWGRYHYTPLMDPNTDVREDELSA